MSGRGGAGNIEAASALSAAKATLPIHHPSPSTADPVEAKLQQQKDEEKRKQEWAHMGRGGAGNYYSPRDLHSQGAFESKMQPVASAADKKPAWPDAPTSTGAYSGRGGAGNYAGVTDDGAVQKEDDTLRAAIERDLEKEMPQEPGRVYLGGRSRDEGGGLLGEGAAADGVDGARRE